MVQEANCYPICCKSYSSLSLYNTSRMSHRGQNSGSLPSQFLSRPRVSPYPSSSPRRTNKSSEGSSSYSSTAPGRVQLPRGTRHEISSTMRLNQALQAVGLKGQDEWKFEAPATTQSPQHRAIFYLQGVLYTTSPRWHTTRQAAKEEAAGLALQKVREDYILSQSGNCTNSRAQWPRFSGYWPIEYYHQVGHLP